MANPSKQRPYAIECRFSDNDRWYAIDAFRTEHEAKEMLPVYEGRAKASNTAVRIRNILEPTT